MGENVLGKGERELDRMRARSLAVVFQNPTSGLRATRAIPAPRDYNPHRGDDGTMERRRLGKTDMQVSVLGFGGSEIGYQYTAPATVARLLGRAFDAGLNVIDTAECYEDSEVLIGRAIAGRRRECFLFTKCGHGRGFKENWRPAALLGSIQKSLRRLETDHLDLIQLHSCSLAVLRRGDAVAALERARERGWTRYLGYSGDGDAARYAIECGRFDALQTSISIADQEAIDLTLPLARERQVGVIAKRPLANVAWRYARRPSEPYHRDYWSRLRALDYPFLREPGEEAVSTALRFTLAVPGVHTAIVGTTRPDRWTENAALLEADALSPRAFERIRERWREVADPSWTGQL
jgi:aryl-alcohol dehydrogenase-like predicted oxidoreductase